GIDDPDVKRRYVGSALGVWLLFLPLLTLVGLILVWVSPAIARVGPDRFAAVRITCSLLVFNFLGGNLLALPESVLRGMNLGYRRMGLQAGLSIVGGLLTAGAIYLGLGLIGVAGAQVVLSVVTGVFFWLLVKKCVPWFGFARPKRSDVRAFL